MNLSTFYKGYQVSAAATPLHNGLYAATLLIQKAADSCAQALQFKELDYFLKNPKRWRMPHAGGACGSITKRVDTSRSHEKRPDPG